METTGNVPTNWPACVRFIRMAKGHPLRDGVALGNTGWYWSDEAREWEGPSDFNTAKWKFLTHLASL